MLVDGYRDFCKKLQQRRMDLGHTSLEIDAIAGLQDGYAAKIECGLKGLGPVSFPLFPAIGLRLALAEGRSIRQRRQL